MIAGGVIKLEHVMENAGKVILDQCRRAGEESLGLDYWECTYDCFDCYQSNLS
jgi:hypothetical protein